MSKCVQRFDAVWICWFRRTAIMRPHWLISVALWMALWWVGWSTAVSAAYRPSVLGLLCASKTLSISCTRAGPFYQNDACKPWAGRVAGGLRVEYNGAMYRHWHLFCILLFAYGQFMSNWCVIVQEEKARSVAARPRFQPVHNLDTLRWWHLFCRSRGVGIYCFCGKCPWMYRYVQLHRWWRSTILEGAGQGLPCYLSFPLVLPGWSDT